MNLKINKQMTKEDILTNHERYIHDFGWGLSIEDAGKAMDEYAKQQAIAFGEWLKDNRWCYQEHLHRPSCWRYFNHETEEDIEKSTEELYNQFIEQQNKDNGSVSDR